MSLIATDKPNFVKYHWHPSPPNRGEPSTFQSYGIFITKTLSEVHLKSQFKNKLERTQVIHGTTELVYNEVLKFLPDNRIEDFKEKWINTKLDKLFSILEVPFHKFVILLGKTFVKTEVALF